MTYTNYFKESFCVNERYFRHGFVMCDIVCVVVILNRCLIV